MRSVFRSQSGLTAAELVISSAILTTVAALVWGTVLTQSRTLSRESGRSMRVSDVRVWLDRMVRDIRVAGHDPTRRNAVTGTPRLFGVQTATASQLTFTVNVDGDGVVDSGSNENRGYRLNGDTLEQWQGGSSWRPIVSDLESLTFRYFDTAGTELNISSPSLRDIAEVEITLTSQADDPLSRAGESPSVARTMRAALRN